MKELSGRGGGLPFPGRYLYLVLSCLLILVSACSRIGNYAVKRADRAAYGIIGETQENALGKRSKSSIDPWEDETTRKLLTESGRVDLDQDASTTPSLLISLNEAITAAIANNRDYKSQREALYQQALSLTETRRDYHYLFTGSATAGAARTDQGRVEEWSGSRGFSLGVSKLLATGASMTLDFSHSFTRFFTGDPRPGASNNLSFSIVQPLLRGAGSLVARETLRQAERDMIYAVREFRRYQQDFIIDAASRYYSILSSWDQLRNTWRNYNSVLDNLQKLEEFYGGGRARGLEVDQARQALLVAELGVTRSLNSYRRRLDEFKIFLGLPIDLDIGPDPGELKRIADRGLVRPDMSLKVAIRSALEDRLDYKNTADRVEDSRRSVKIALQNFLPNLDANYSYNTSTGAEKDRVRLDFQDNTNQFSLDLGIPFDWTPRRNNYRNALINLDQAKRSLELFREQLVLDVRDAWRNLEEARTEYRIQEQSVILAERRVRQSSLFLQSGKASARDLIEAEDDLLEARNSLTNALISHTLQRLQFWNTIERLEIDEKGMWVESDRPMDMKPGGKAEE